MTPREISALVSTVLVIIGTVWYIRLTLTSERIRPIMATWIVTSCGTILSFATYWTSPKHNLVSNAYNAISIVTINAILFTIIHVSRERGIPLIFTPFQKWCLWISAGITAYWIILVWGLGRTGTVPNVLTQILMMIGYLITAQKLWHAERNTEPTGTWWLIFAAGMVAMCTGILSRNGLAVLFAARTSVGTGMLIFCMIRAERKFRQTQQAGSALQAEKLHI